MTHQKSDIPSTALKLLNSQKSLHLATCSSENQACISYAPFITRNNRLYILVSDLAEHTHNLRNNASCSAMIILDEQASVELFARQRLQYQMNALQIERSSKIWAQVITHMKTELGDIVHQLVQLTDFHLFELEPLKGKFINGFGQAYTLEESTLISKKIRHIGPRSK
jgi:putative heme iron utilization protein